MLYCIVIYVYIYIHIYTHTRTCVKIHRCSMGMYCLAVHHHTTLAQRINLDLKLLLSRALPTNGGQALRFRLWPEWGQQRKHALELSFGLWGAKGLGLLGVWTFGPNKDLGNRGRHSSDLDRNVHQQKLPLVLRVSIGVSKHLLCSGKAAWQKAVSWALGEFLPV